AVNAGWRARVGVVPAPAAGVGTEGGKLERGGHKVPVPSGQRLEDAGRAEGDDVGSGIPVYVRERARVGVVAAPAAGVGTEGGKLERGRRKVPASYSERLEDADRAEADDVGHAVGVYVRKRARIGVVAAPAAGVGTDGANFERGRRKAPASCGQRLEDAA